MNNDPDKYKKWIAILDDLETRAKQLKEQKKDPLYGITERKRFDFEKIAFERLKNKIGNSEITLKEYYRLIGVWYSLKKIESRNLLLTLKKKIRRKGT